MKSLLSIAVLGLLGASAHAGDYVNFLRQEQQDNGVVWDMPVEATGASNSALALEKGGALFQLWTIEQEASADYLLDQKLVGAYLPVAAITVTTLDPHGDTPRTRIDQPFTVKIDVSGLLTGGGFPLSASSVVLERHLATSPDEETSIDPSIAVSGTPASSAFIKQNGATVLRFSASALNAEDPTKAVGEEHFVVHAIAEDQVSQSQIASARLQVWPIASGTIKGINNGDELRFETPPVELLLNDLYPRSDSYLLLYNGTQVAGATGTVVKAYPVDRDTPDSNVLRVTELDSLITEDGTYTLALLSDTVYGRELLCDPVTFTVNRTMRVNAMQVSFSDSVEN